MSLWARVKAFPDGLKKLYNDYMTYVHIEDASRTKLNAWTIRHPLSRRRWKKEKGVADNGKEFSRTTEFGSRIPRRQQEHRRRVMQDLRMALPTALGSLLPFLGYAFIVLGITFPRIFLSRQFLTDEEIKKYAEMEYRLRLGYYFQLGEHFWNTLMINVRTLPPIEIEKYDAAGPIPKDILVFYQVFEVNDRNENASEVQSLPLPMGIIMHFVSIPREHLETLAFASRGSRLPAAYRILPSAMIQRKLRRVADDIRRDDVLLIEEEHDVDGCHSLTDSEVLDACLLRGLPVGTSVSYHEMRECLTNHLSMIAQVANTFPKFQRLSVHDTNLKLFTLHLPAIRYHLMRKEGFRRRPLTDKNS